MLKRLIPAVFLVALIASACGASDKTPVETTTSTSDATSNDSTGEVDVPDEPAAETVAPAATKEAVVDPDPDAPTMAAASPIGAFFEEGGGFEAAIAEYTVKVEEQLVICMAAQGFEFARSSPSVAEIDRLQGELTVLEWTTQFGYGISTSFESVVAQQTADPNADILFSLSASERDIWIKTLTGQDGFGALAADEAPALEEQGCIGESIITTGGGAVIEGLETFGAAYEEAEEALLDRREMIDAVDAWSRCMSESGYPDMGEQGDAEAQVQERFDTITAPLQAALADIDPADGRALIEGDSAELEELPGLDVPALRQLQADEVTIALADLACYDTNVKATFEPLRDNLERGLLTEYGSELDALRNIGG